MFSAKLMMSNPKMWRYNLVWNKGATTGFLNANRMPLRQHEDILVFYKRLPVYNPQMECAGPHRRNHGKGAHAHAPVNNCYGKFIDTPVVISDEKYPTSIIKTNKEHQVGQFFHPTQKPVALCEWLIKTYTNPGETVLDNCMGSGSTGVACVRTGRDFIGIELDDNYFNIAKNRIEQEQSNIDGSFLLEGK